MWAWPVQGGLNSGRKVMSTSTGRRCTRSTTSSSSSSVVGSLQCTSSYSASTGCSAARPASWPSSASKRPLLLPLRAQVRAAGSGPPAGIAEQGGEQRRGRGHVLGAPGEQRLQLVELASGRVVAGEAGRALEQADDRVERAGLVVGASSSG